MPQRPSMMAMPLNPTPFVPDLHNPAAIPTLWEKS